MDDVSYDELTLSMVGRDSSVGMTTRYGLDGPDIKSRWGEKYSTPVQTGSGAHLAPCTRAIVSFQRKKRPNRGVDHPPPSSPEFKERVELYLHSFSESSWPVLRLTLPLLLRFTLPIYYLQKRFSR